MLEAFFSLSSSITENTLFLNLRFVFFCKVPTANVTLGWVSVTVVVGIGTAVAVSGAITLLVSICLIIGATKVSDAFTTL